MRIIIPNIFKITAVLLLLCIVAPAYGQFYDGSNQSFGKNRVQYKKFVWQYYRSDRFDTYFYEGGKDLAAYVNKIANDELTQIENFLDYPLDERLNFVVYTSQSDFRQSNVGMVDLDGYNLGGKTQFIGDKLFIYYEGDYNKLKKSIRYGVATVLLNKMILGGSWTEMVKNSTLIQLPDWYMEGLLRYIADPEDMQMHEFVKDGVLSGEFDNINRLEKEESIIAGYGIWNYIASVYGETIIPNVLYMTRVSRNIEGGLLYVLGIDLKALISDELFYYKEKYKSEDLNRKEITSEPLPIKTKPHLTYSQFTASFNGSKLAYVANEMGQYKIYIYDELTQKSKRIYTGDHKLDRIVDKSFPVLAWNPTNDDLSIVIEAKGELFMYTYSTAEKKMYTRQIVGLDKILHFEYASNGKEMIMSAVRFGQTDLYLYYMLGNRQERLTNDINDDLYPSYTAGNNKIIFSSNRDDDTLRDKSKEVIEKRYDIFIYDLETRSPILEQITKTPDQSEIFPAQYDDIRYTYLSDHGGVYNRYIAEYDSMVSRIDTAIHYRYFTNKGQLSNYKRNVLEYNVNRKAKQYTQLMYYDGRYKFFKNSLPEIKDLSQLQFEEEKVVEALEQEEGQEIIATPTIDSTDTTGEIDINNYQFEGEEKNDSVATVVVFEDYTELEQIQEVEDTVKAAKITARSYRVNFAKDYSVTQLTNSFGNKFYQSVEYGPNNLNPGLSPLIKLGVSDLFEDYRLTGGFRFSSTLSNNDYGLTYDNLLNRLDKKLVFQRQSITGLLEEQFSVIRIRSHFLTYQLKWPFNEVLSVRANFTGRHERTVFLSINTPELERPNNNTYMAGGKLELVRDNTISYGLNLFNGTRYKIWAEYYAEYIEEGDYPTFGVAGFDFRHYERIHRDIIFAGRIAGNTSFGSTKLLNYLGGVDNWILPRPESENSPVDQSQNYRYQALISPMRGFWKNARNGTSAVVASAELRIPLFKYLLNRPIHSDFVQNFQVIGFGDVGSAWTGSGPYAEDNSFNTITSSQGSLLIEVENQVDPFIQGVGFGLRSRLFGYFIRADWSWGIVDERFLPRQFYLSFNLDF